MRRQRRFSPTAEIETSPYLTRDLEGGRMRSRPSPMFGRLLAGLALLTVLYGCGDTGTDSTGPEVGSDARLRLTAVVAGTPIAVVSAEVTATDIATPLRFNLSLIEGVASGTLRLPPGTARTITVRAFEASGSITHEGQATVDIRAGQNPPVAITLRSRAGQLPITATLGEISVVVSPAAVDVAVGAGVQLTATILDVDGNPVDGTVEWAVLNPAFASVSATGLVTGLVEGETFVGASYEGVAGSSTVTVLPADVSGLYSGTATSDVTGQVSGLPVSLGSDAIMGCSNPCPASLDLTQDGPTSVEGTITVGSRSFSGSFALESVAGGLVISAAAVDLSFDLTFQTPLGTVVVPTTCTIDASGGIDLDPTPAALTASGAVPLSCSGSGSGLTIGASGTVTLDLIRGG
jgi:hypothetical protein